MKNLLLYLVAVAAILILGCAASNTSGDPNYYVYTSPRSIPIYTDSRLKEEVLVIPAGSYFVIHDWSKKKSKVRFKNSKGYIRSSSDYSYQYQTIYPEDFEWRGDSFFLAKRYVPNKSQALNNESINNSSSGSKSKGGPVQVRGYYRKDGTYVAPYTRSAPGTKKKN